MNKFKLIFKSAGSRVWFTVSAVLIAVLIVVTSLCTTYFRSILGTVLGGPNPVKNPAVEEVFTSDYKSKNEVLEAGNKLNEEIEGEGAVLLVNEDNALPLKKNSKISVFGKNSVDLVLSGSGSGSGGNEGSATLYDGFEGLFEVNHELKSFYESSASGSGRSDNPDTTEGTEVAPTLDIGETPVSSYTSKVKASFKDYNDAAIVVISRIGGESFDLPRAQNTKNGGIEGNHYLQLDANEYALLDMVTSKFDKVVVLLNTLTSFQLDFIEEYNNTVDQKRIDAVMWIGGPGISGAKAIGSLLSGDINPSGKTVDIYPRDFTKDPTWQNFGDNSQNFNGTPGASFTENGDNVAGKYMVTYEEGIYVGYKYYETRGFEELLADSTSNWYDENVVFPFGFGLSYTEFSQTMNVTGSVEEGIEFSVTVTNTGKVAGKEVVQLYVTLPYYRGQIEKSHVQLLDFAKTELLQPNETQTVKFNVNAYELASYDYIDANKNQHFGYELDAGDYVFAISENSHIDEYAFDTKTVKLEEGITFKNDPVTGKPVGNLYTTEDYFDSQYRLSDVTVRVDGEEYTRKGMSRTDFEGTFPTAPDKDERELMNEINGVILSENDALNDKTTNNPTVYEGMPDMGNGEATYEYTDADGNTVKRQIMLRDLFGKAYDDSLWDDLLNRLTYDDMIKLVNYGAFQTSAILSIGKNLTNDSDGPVGFINFMIGLASHYKGNPSFASEIVIASTWSKDLAYQMGKIVGETGLWGDVGGNNLPYTGWYAPAVNIHRSPFSGRNYEYYSEDAVLSGKLAVNVINGAMQKGVYTDLKHFALNDQETNRGGVATYCTEQALREIYLKPFEIAVKGLDNPEEVPSAAADGIVEYVGSHGIMSSFNRIGTRWTGGDYRLITSILRVEWGFNGLVISDYKTSNAVMDARQMVYAGNDLILTSIEDYRWLDASSSSEQDVNILRNAAHNILYAVANSNSVNVDIVGYRLEWWITALIVVDCVVAIGLAVWGFFAVRNALKNHEN